MSIYRFCNKSGASLNQAKRWHKAGWLRVDLKANEPEQEIIYWLKRDTHLTVRHIVVLLEKPSILGRLNSQSEKARMQLNEVGEAKKEAAPNNVVASIAARKMNEESVALLIDWLQSILPERPVSQYWIGARIAFGLPVELRVKRSAFIRYALRQCREHPRFQGWWRYALFEGCRTVDYQRPKRMFDL